MSMGSAETEAGLTWTTAMVAFQRSLRRFENTVRPVLRDEKLSELGFTNVYMLLTVGEGGRRQADLVNDDSYAGSNVTYAISTLTREGLVLRTKDPEDGRVRIIVPTERGRRLIRTINEKCLAEPSHIAAALKVVNNFESRFKPAAAASVG
jgi:DNA-binding MarR family transcriptional regulator